MQRAIRPMPTPRPRRGQKQKHAKRHEARDSPDQEPAPKPVSFLQITPECLQERPMGGGPSKWVRGGGGRNTFRQSVSRSSDTLSDKVYHGPAIHFQTRCIPGGLQCISGQRVSSPNVQHIAREWYCQRLPADCHELPAGRQRSHNQAQMHAVCPPLSKSNASNFNRHTCTKHNDTNKLIGPQRDRGESRRSGESDRQPSLSLSWSCSSS